jgi:thioester reductase-like protein
MEKRLIVMDYLREWISAEVEEQRVSGVMLRENKQPELFLKWLDFNDRILTGQKTIWVEEQKDCLRSKIWLTAFYSGKAITISKQPEEADIWLMPLRRLKSRNLSRVMCKTLITFGDDRMEFETIRNQLPSGVRWINYYGFPYIFCTSWCSGRRGGRYAHQLKPVSGTTIEIVNDEGGSVPEYAEGLIRQQTEGNGRSSFFRGRIADGRLFAGGYDAGIVYAAGSYPDSRQIYDALVCGGDCRDVCVDGTDVYYVLGAERNVYEIRQTLAGAIGWEEASALRLLEVPHIAVKNTGEPDFSALRKMTEDLVRVLEETPKSFLAAHKDEIAVLPGYEDQARALSEHRTSGEKNRRKMPEIEEKPAVIEMPPIAFDCAKASDLCDMLRKSTLSEGEILYLDRNGSSRQSYRELYQEARRTAAGMKAAGISSGDLIILQIPDNRDYLTAFWACMIIGATAAPMGVLDDYGEKNLNADKLINICETMEIHYVLSEGTTADQIEQLLTKETVLRFDALAEEVHEEFQDYIWRDDETCMLMFTSGSTGIPKGARLSQKNIFARTLGDIERFHWTEQDVYFNWMTLTHAAGIINTHILGLYLGMVQIQAESEVILQDPLRFLQILSDYKATLTWTPNFLYTLIRDLYKPEKDYHWDLSRVRHIFSTAEANVSRDHREFLKIGMRYGLPGDALIPCFGMTETASCMIYYTGFRLENTSDEDAFVPIGCPLNGHRARVTLDGKAVRKGEIGSIEYQGDTVTAGYYKNDAANRESFTEDGYFISGDLGYITGTDLVLTGREKEIIIVNGLNYYVQDIEAVVNEVPGVSPSYTAAVSVEVNGKEEILIVCTPKEDSVLRRDADLRKLTGEIRRAVQKHCGLYAKFIVPDEKEKSIRTEIGKKQRSRYRRKFVNGEYDDVLRRTGVLKEENYLMETCWIPKVYQGGYREDSSSVRIEPVIDRAFAGTDIRRFAEKAIDMAKEWCALPDGTRIVVPTVYGIALPREHVNAEAYCAESMFLGGLIRSFNQENPGKHCMQADFDAADPECIRKEAFGNDRTDTVVYRKGKRYIRGYRTISEQDVSSEEMPVLPDRSGIALIGGCGGIGSFIAPHLADRYHAPLLLIGRREETGEITDLLGKLRGKGQFAMYLSADASDGQALSDAVAEFESRANLRIRMFFNLAGRFGPEPARDFWSDIGSHTISREKRSDFVQIVSEKFRTMKNLETLSKQRNAMLITSGSVNGIQGGNGLCAYSAASSFACRYTDYLNAAGRIASSCINWSGWYDTGLGSAIPSDMIALSQHSGFRFANPEENLTYLDLTLKYRLTRPIAGLDRADLKNQAFTADPFHGYLRVYHTIAESRLQELPAVYRTGKDVRYIKTDAICRLSDRPEDIDRTRMKRFGSASAGTAGESAEEKRMAKVWERVLHQRQVTLDDDFFDLGGNSLLITRLAYEIEKETNQSVSLQDILMAGTVRNLVRLMNQKDPDGTEEGDDQKSRKQMEEDIRLDPELKKLAAAAGKRPECRSAVLTGATGFVGAYLLAELIKRDPGRTVFCIVRAKDQSAAAARLKENLMRYRLLADGGLPAGIVPVAGDIAMYHLGAEDELYHRMSHEAGEVIHAAADVNFVLNYAQIRKTDVAGIREILRLCAAGNIKILHFVSSLSVYSNTRAEDVPEADERAEIPITARDAIGYSQAKLVCEEIVKLASDAGIPCKIYRAPAMMGDSVNGMVQQRDFFWRIIWIILKTKKIPQVKEYVKYLIPVDVFAEQMLDLAAIPNDPANNIYNMTGCVLRYPDLIRWLRERDPDIRAVPYPEWKCAVYAYAKEHQHPIAESVQGVLPDIDPDLPELRTTSFRSDKTDRIMQENSVTAYDKPDEALEQTYRYLLGAGFFE